MLIKFIKQSAHSVVVELNHSIVQTGEDPRALWVKHNTWQSESSGSPNAPFTRADLLSNFTSIVLSRARLLPPDKPPKSIFSVLWRWIPLSMSEKKKFKSFKAVFDLDNRLSKEVNGATKVSLQEREEHNQVELFSHSIPETDRPKTVNPDTSNMAYFPRSRRTQCYVKAWWHFWEPRRNGVMASKGLLDLRIVSKYDR